MNRKTTALSLLTLGLLVGLVSCNHQQNPTHEHRLVKVDGDEPTCLSEYYKTYWKCEDCNMLFLDEAGTQETTVDNLKLPAENHKDENNDFYCDYTNCYEMVFSDEFVQKFYNAIENTLKLTDVHIRESIVPTARDISYYIGEDFLYINENEGLDKQYFYTSGDKTYSLTLNNEEWIKEESTKTLSYTVNDLFEGIHDLESTSGLNVTKQVIGILQGKTIFRYLNSSNCYVGFALNESQTLLDGIVIYDENGNFTNEFQFVVGRDEMMVDAFKALDCIRNGHTLEDVVYDFSADNSACTASVICPICNETFTETATMVPTEKGFIANFENEIFKSQESIIVNNVEEFNEAITKYPNIILDYESSFGLLTVPSNTTVTIDLNGKTIDNVNVLDGSYVTFVNSGTEYWGRIHYFEVGASNIKMKKLTEIWFEIKLNSNVAYIDLTDSKATVLGVIPIVDGCNTSQIDLGKNEFWHNDILRLPETVFTGELEKNKTYYVGRTVYDDLF